MNSTPSTTGRVSHKRFEKSFRCLNNGRKRYPEGIAKLIAGAALWRAAKKTSFKQWLDKFAPRRAAVLAPEVKEDIRADIVEAIADESGKTPALSKKMSRGYTTVLLFEDGETAIGKAQVFRIKDAAERVLNPVKHRSRESLLSTGWREATLNDFPLLIELLGEHETRTIVRRIGELENSQPDATSVAA